MKSVTQVPFKRSWIHTITHSIRRSIWLHTYFMSSLAEPQLWEPAPSRLSWGFKVLLEQKEIAVQPAKASVRTGYLWAQNFVLERGQGHLSFVKGTSR